MDKKTRARLLKQFDGSELEILKSFGKGDFDKHGVRGNSQRLSDKHGGDSSSWKRKYLYMKKYGLLEKIYPEKFETTYTHSFATRLSKENLNKLRDLKKETGNPIVELVNEAIEKFIIK